ncbi:MAG: acyl-CoA dehydrogenase family protein [Burkholderiaceae bacterium]
MSFILNEDQLAVQDLVRRVAREKVASRASDIDKTAQYPQDMFDLLRDLGLFTLPFPVEYGGMGSSLAACIAIEELVRVCYNTGYLLAVQWTPFGAILSSGTEEQKQMYLPGLANGTLRGAFSLTESQSGSDVAGILTTAEKKNGGFVLNGAKIWCTGASIADFILIAAKSHGTQERAKVNLYFVNRNTKGLQIGPKEDKMGARGIPSCPLFLDDVFVPSNARLGEEGKGFKIVMETMNTARPLHAARGVGLAQGAIDHAIAFVQQRHAFGQKVSDFQGVRWMLADMQTQTEAARSLVYRTASMVDQGIRGQELASFAAMSKAFATDTAMEVATDAVQLFGASGISSDYPINRYMRDAKVLQIIEGTNQIQRNIVANGMLGRPPR